MPIARPSIGDSPPNSKRVRLKGRPVLSFFDEDKIGTLKPHDDTQVVTLRIGGYDVKRVLVDQGNGVEIMCPNLYKRLKLRPEDLANYDSPLIGFNEKIVFSKGQIRLPVQTRSELNAYSPYTAIVARPWLHAMEAVPSTLHLKVKYPLRDRVKELEKEELITFLRNNLDVFVWSAYKAPGVDPNFICHHLNVNPSTTLKRQPHRRSSKEHFEAVREEVIKLKQVRAIKEVFYSEWMANTVVVKKKNGRWREKTTFVTPTGNYHYKVTPFGLKNAGFTYQRMMTRMFEPQLSKNIEVYIDDMVVKIKVVSEHVGDLRSIFEILRRHKLRLNASKCSFGIGLGKFLGK
ncbi:uncharacterized protein LOC142635727 [Castanea sativa]|uniref:uncharacterized protein LOC142635727 n=1 Tax=Castanea sativa TaxID=21020 RepID=UPI003F64991B